MKRSCSCSRYDYEYNPKEDSGFVSSKRSSMGADCSPRQGLGPQSNGQEVPNYEENDGVRAVRSPNRLHLIQNIRAELEFWLKISYAIDWTWLLSRSWNGVVIFPKPLTLFWEHSRFTHPRWKWFQRILAQNHRIGNNVAKNPGHLELLCNLRRVLNRNGPPAIGQYSPCKY